MLRSRDLPGHDGEVIRSDDGALAFTVMRRANGLFVERVHVRQGRAQVVQSALFADEDRFTRWCDADPVRFTHPIVYVNLKRSGDELFRRRQ